MPAYKDAERMTPEQLAKFILKERVCKNCKWFGEEDTYEKEKVLVCKNESMSGYTPREYPYTLHLAPPPDFGCNQWEAK